MNLFNIGDCVTVLMPVAKDQSKMVSVTGTIISFYKKSVYFKHYYSIVLDEPFEGVEKVEFMEVYLTLHIQSKRDKLLKGLIDE